jgi:hypothetical protein
MSGMRTASMSRAIASRERSSTSCWGLVGSAPGVGALAQTTLRTHLRELEDLGAIAKQPPSALCQRVEDCEG